jgi:predicted nucleic acid-binding protein
MTLIDSNVLIDIWTQDPKWLSWSTQEFSNCLARGEVAINPVIYSELSLGFATELDLEAAVKTACLTKLPLPFSASFASGRAFQSYRKRGVSSFHDSAVHQVASTGAIWSVSGSFHEQHRSRNLDLRRR